MYQGKELTELCAKTWCNVGVRSKNNKSQEDQISKSIRSCNLVNSQVIMAHGGMELCNTQEE